MNLSTILVLICTATIGYSHKTPLPGPDNWDRLPEAQHKIILERETVSTVPSGTISGIIFAFHGCLQYVTQFGFASTACPTCHGTPEVMTLVYKAVQRGYAVVAVGAHRGGDKWRCYETHWPPEEHNEISGIIKVMKHIMTERKWWHLPRYAFGSSSGGCVALELALRFPLQGVASMLMGLHLNTLGEALQPRNPHNGHVWDHPPVIILRTLQDEDSVIERVNRTLIALHNQGALTQKIELQPYLLTPHFFAERMRGVDAEVSQKIFARLQDIDVINKDGLCIWKKCENCWDPLYEKMKSALWDLFPQWEDLYYDAAFKEMLWASEGVHETTSEYTDDIIDFFETRASTMPILAADHPALHAEHESVDATAFLGSPKQAQSHVSDVQRPNHHRRRTMG
ncbi:hypothetical protein COCOBI_12-2330 [Coccomyxa sp. Obi]|nr:hypothetical protein COCOBI_12-2330 [Coccomyxa sp. Obi]